MKLQKQHNLNMTRLCVCLSTIGLLSYLPVHAEEISAKSDHQLRGKMIDRSRVLDAHVPASSEVESSQFANLLASSLTVTDKKTMLDTVVPEEKAQQNLQMQDAGSGKSLFTSGRAELRPDAIDTLNAIVSDLQGKQQIHMEIVGHTDSQRISRSLQAVYPNNQKLSEARALAVAAYFKQALQLSSDAFTVQGKGESEPVASNMTADGMQKNRRVVLRIWYHDAPDVVTAAEVAKADTLQCAPNAATKAMPFSITVDGQAIDDTTKTQEADGQRCVDVALEKTDIQIKYDPLNVVPALNVWAAPSTAVRGYPVYFGSYTNYAWWIKRSELRIFAKGQNPQETPFAVVPISEAGSVSWKAPDNAPTDLVYLVRAYDEKNRFDETLLKPLRLADKRDPLVTNERLAREKLSGWGESSLFLKNIPAKGGSVTISGDKVQPNQHVTAMGLNVPVDDNGKFVLRQILPPGPHHVSVAVKNDDGQGMSFARNLSIADNDWFYVAVADLTMGKDNTSGPAKLVTEDTQHYDNSTWIDGRGAFYLKGKIKGEYLLTASADTREQPIEDLFSNFQSKDPYYLLRRIDPDKYYPVYGDDSTIYDDAPTQGKFYVKLEKDNASVMWGNFKTAWTGTELTQYSRGLYGANMLWHDKETTQFGEKRTSVNAFAADPGTLQSREEFRGTGGSLYYLHHMDATEGSERVWVEIRDKDSGLVIQRTPLTAAQDYEINYLQGRIVLRAPLPSVADGSTLVQTSSANGNPVYLIATYEYVPGLSEIDSNAIGVRASHWVNDHFRLGASLYRQGERGQDQTLKGIDTTLRYAPGTWVKAEMAQSKGIGSTALSSLSGGYDFTQNQIDDTTANAKRVDVAVDLADVSQQKGKLSAYWQERDAGYSGPGLATPNGEAVEQKGFAAAVPVTERTEVSAKVDDKDATLQSLNASEVAVRHKIDPEWGVSVGLRHDKRDNANIAGVVTNASSLLQDGTRSDVIVRADYRPLAENQKSSDTADASVNAQTQTEPLTNTVNNPTASLMAPDKKEVDAGQTVTVDATSVAGVAAARVAGMQYKSWDTYGFVQGTVERSGQRQRNDRVGVGGSWQALNSLRLGTEMSGGDGGLGGRLTGDYQVNDRSSVYLTYTMETESSDNNYAGRQGTLAAGTHYRFNDQVGMFGETRWSDGDGPKSLTHAFGVDFSPEKNWTFGVKYETGTLSDPISGDIDRDAIGVSAAYKDDRLKYTTAIEYRNDRTTTLGNVAGTCLTSDINGNCAGVAGSNNRRTWLLKNAAQYQLDTDWRLLGKLNLSRSNNSQGAFYDGDYTETVLGAAYRPVNNDRWNTLFKYTYFYNLPSPGQVDSVTGGALDYSQKSHVLNVDTTYDVLPWLSVGVKYGMRFGKLRMSKTEGEWYSSRADLLVLRADLHFVKEWDALIESRRLRVHEADDSRSGYLVGVYRHVTDHVKVGVGYNFTDFSDNLTDMSYRSRGWFINALATF